ncbi:MAG: Dna2/Cas4 domain-containing protein [Candidatus Magasanikbacteria bacterium]
MQLSKSDYIKFLKHPAWLWLKKHQKHKLPDPDANLQAIFEAGNRFEQIVYDRFPDGVEIGFDEDDLKTYEQMTEKTQQAIANGAETMFQPRFETNDLTCIPDIIQRVEGNTFDLYEIKSSTSVKSEHKHDLAFQTIVLEDSGLEVNDIFVIHVNNDYKKDGEIEPAEISNIEKITDKTKAKIDKTKENIQQAFEVMSSEQMPDPSPANKQMGKMEDWMDIYEHIFEIEQHSIYKLTGSTKILKQLEEQNIQTVEGVPENIDLNSKNQKHYVKAAKQDKRLTDKKR